MYSFYYYTSIVSLGFFFLNLLSDYSCEIIPPRKPASPFGLYVQTIFVIAADSSIMPDHFRNNIITLLIIIESVVKTDSRFFLYMEFVGLENFVIFPTRFLKKCTGVSVIRRMNITISGFRRN